MFAITMWNFSYLSKEKNDKLEVLLILFLLTIFLIWKAIVESGHLLFYIACFILWIIAYFSFKFIHKKMVSKPASLGRDYAKKYPIIVQYAPPKWINPAEAWLLYNRSVEPTDLTSLIYQWKFEDLIDIKTFTWTNSGKEYIKLIKKNDIPLTRPLFESEIFGSIFAMNDIKIIEWAFQLRYALMLEDLEYHWIQKWWLYRKKIESKTDYDKDKAFEKLDILWLYSFFILLPFILDLFNFSINFNTLIWFIIVAFLFVLCLALLLWKLDWWAKLKFTDKWAELASQVIWYSQFIKSCDENKIKLLLREDPLFIDRTLPYATAFWMETEFLKKISPLKKDWNAKYVRWTKIPSRVWVLRFLVKDDNSWF